MTAIDPCSTRAMESRLAALGFCCLLAVGAGCGKKEAPPAEEPVRPVKMIEVGAQDSTGRREFPGQIAATTEADVSFEVGGRIVDLPVAQGQWVKTGELLARLDPADYQARLDAAVAQRNAAKADYDRYQELLAKNAVSRRDFETRQRNWEVSEAALRIDQKNLADTNLRAPFTGRVSRKYVEQFQNVQAKQPILLLQDSGHLEIDVSLPEADLLRVDPSLDLKTIASRFDPMVAISSIPGATFPARLTELATAADPKTRTFEATFAFDSPTGVTILPGMTALVRLSASAADNGGGFALPSTAVLMDESGAAFVWKVDQTAMEVRKTRVEVGQLQGGSALVKAGLERGDLVAASGTNQLREGMKVRRMEEP